MGKSVPPSIEKPGKGRQTGYLFAAYGVFVLLVLAVLYLQNRVVNLAHGNNLAELPPTVRERVRYLYGHLVWNAASLTTTTSLNSFLAAGHSKSHWEITGEAQEQTVYFVFDRPQDSLIHFSQSAPAEWTTEREQWTVNNAQSAVAAGQRYLHLLGWERPGSHWELQQRPYLAASVWRVVYRQGERRASLRLHRWNGALVTFVMDIK